MAKAAPNYVSPWLYDACDLEEEKYKKEKNGYLSPVWSTKVFKHQEGSKSHFQVSGWVLQPVTLLGQSYAAVQSQRDSGSGAAACEPSDDLGGHGGCWDRAG